MYYANDNMVIAVSVMIMIFIIMMKVIMILGNNMLVTKW